MLNTFQQIDHATRVNLVLALNFIVVRDRMETIERVCAANNIIFIDKIEAYHRDQHELETPKAHSQEPHTRLYYLARKDAPGVLGL